jgi:hypothetical protein
MDDELRGWKAIADHLGTSDRTAQRWERDLGLPVRRAGHSRGSTVAATRRELDEWRHSPAGARADGEVAGDREVAAAPVAGQGGWRRPRWVPSVGVVVGISGVLLAAIAMWFAGRPAVRARDAVRDASAAPTAVQRSWQAGPSPVVVLRLTADTGEVWTVRLVEGATATWEVAGGRTIGLAVGRDGERARLTVSDQRAADAGADRPSTVAVASLGPGASTSIAEAGRRVTVEWVGTEAGPSGRAAPSGVVPPRCCLACGGVTVCATEVSGWCGSCCDPRYTTCRPPI